MFFKKKYDKLKRGDVIDAIIQLEQQESDIEKTAEAKQVEIDALLSKGKDIKDRQLQLFYAKKINHLKAERQNDLNRGMYLMYNIQLLRKLKDAIDDNNFITNVGKVPLNVLLKDQKGLSQFLNKALGNKLKSEDVLTGATEIFDDVQNSYEPNEAIYGINDSDDALLAIFETDAGLKAEADIGDIGTVTEKNKDALL